MINLHIYPSPMALESRILKETAALARRGRFRTIVMVGVSAPGLPSVEPLDDVRQVERVPRRRGAGLVGKTLSTLQWSVDVYRRWRREPVACVNCHSLPVLPLCVALKLRTGAKLVYDTHELETETNGLTGVRRLALKVVERVLIGFVDAVIVVSDSIANWYQSAYGRGRPAVVLNCPPRRSRPPAGLLHSSLGLPASTPIYLYQGVLARGRGIEVLLESFLGDSRPDGVAVFLGNGPLEEQVRAAAARTAAIRWHPAVEPAVLLEYTASASVGFCLIEKTCLSYDFCMPNKLFEYLAAGVPVIATDLAELGPFVRNRGIGVVVPTPPASTDVIEALCRVLALPAAALRGQIEVVNDAYQWARQEDVLIAVYDRLFAGRAADA